MIKPDWTAKIPLKALSEHQNCESAYLKEPNVILVTRKNGEHITIYTTAGGIIDSNEIWELSKRNDIDFILCLKSDTLIEGAIIDHLANKKISIGNMKEMMWIVANPENWPFANPQVKFIMQGLSQHKKVSEVKRANNHKYLIKRHGMKDIIIIPTQDYDVVAQSVRGAFELAKDAQVVLAVNPNRRITSEAYSVAKNLELDLCTWSEFLVKLNSSWN